MDIVSGTAQRRLQRLLERCAVTSSREERYISKRGQWSSLGWKGGCLRSDFTFITHGLLWNGVWGKGAWTSRWHHLWFSLMDSRNWNSSFCRAWDWTTEAIAAPSYEYKGDDHGMFQYWEAALRHVCVTPQPQFACFRNRESTGPYCWDSVPIIWKGSWVMQA